MYQYICEGPLRHEVGSSLRGSGATQRLSQLRGHPFFEMSIFDLVMVPVFPIALLHVKT